MFKTLWAKSVGYASSVASAKYIILIIAIAVVAWQIILWGAGISFGFWMMRKFTDSIDQYILNMKARKLAETDPAYAAAIGLATQGA